jgi:hypothetical protein
MAGDLIAGCRQEAIVFHGGRKQMGEQRIARNLACAEKRAHGEAQAALAPSSKEPLNKVFGV